MKITPDDPALTAYALGELTEAESTKVSAVLAANDQLSKEAAGISGLADLLNETLRGDVLSLGEDRRAEILKSGQRPDSDVLVLEHRKRARRQSLIVLTGVAAVVVAGFVGLSRLGVERPDGGGTGEVANGGGGSNSSVNSIVPKLGSIGSGGEVTPSIAPTVNIPLQIASVDPSFVERSLVKTGSLPPRKDFKIETWINAASADADPGVVLGDVGVYAELGPCSWNEEVSLLMVNLRPLNGKNPAIQATLNFNPDRVKAARLLGTSGDEKNSASNQSALKTSQTLLYEVELLPGEDLIGSVNLESEDAGPGYLTLASEPLDNDSLSSDFESARVLAQYAKWGASQSRGLESLSELAMRAKQLLGLVKDGKTRYALDMILLSEESMKK